MIRESLAGRRIAITGAAGFLGQALLERLVHDIPVARIDVYMRGDADARLTGIVAGGAFASLRSEIGSEALRERVAPVVRAHPADLARDPIALPPDTDIVIHTAATVSFDPPIDEAFETNLVGTIRMLEAAAGRRFIHISTAYVAGMTRGVQAEEPLRRDVDWRAELDHALRTRARVEDASRTPEVLDSLIARARAATGRAGPLSVAARAEELRHDWVRRRLVAHGRARARSLGWPDVYTFTKALAETALAELRGDTPVQIIRPSIIESALRHPYPGWIEGFRMAEPVILAFGRGALPEFPGVPEGVIDIIPVDLVVNCILAVAAAPPEDLGFYHCSSGSRNPLTFRGLYEITREYFLAHPLPQRGRGALRVPEWTFPGRRKVQGRMDAAERAIAWMERGVAWLPRGKWALDAARRVDRLRARLEFVKRYAGLYGPYTEAEVVYTDERARALGESLPEEDRRDFGFDPAAFGWREYLQGIHHPSITTLVRQPRAPRPEPRVVVSPNGGERPVLAVFDVEGTIVSANVLEAYLWLRLQDAPREEWPERLADLLRRVPRLLGAERRDRGEFLRRFYVEYAGARAAEVRGLARERMAALVLRRLAPAAVARIREHRAAGHRVVLVTGSLDFVVAPLSSLVHDVVAARLRESDGVFTGDLERPPLVGEARALWLRRYAAAQGADLADCYAYADSMSDLPLLETAGKPVAVNPDVSLGRVARARRWPVEHWLASRGTPRIMIPEPVP